MKCEILKSYLPYRTYQINIQSECNDERKEFDELFILLVGAAKDGAIFPRSISKKENLDIIDSIEIHV